MRFLLPALALCFAMSSCAVLTSSESQRRDARIDRARERYDREVNRADERLRKQQQKSLRDGKTANDDRDRARNAERKEQAKTRYDRQVEKARDTYDRRTGRSGR